MNLNRKIISHLTQNFLPSINPAIYGGVGTKAENPGFSHYLIYQWAKAQGSWSYLVPKHKCWG